MSQLPSDLALRFWVDDVPNAGTAGTRLNKILVMLEKGQPITALGKQYLADRGLLVLTSLANGQITEDQFEKLARSERDVRISYASAQQQIEDDRIKAEANAAKEREAAMWLRLDEEKAKRENDPRFIAKQKNRELRRKFGIETFVEEDDFHNLMTILRKLNSGARLSEEEAIWLRTEGSAYDSREIQQVYHRIESDFFIGEYKRSGDVWMAVSASSHLRKCDASKEAHELLKAISDSRLKQPKLKSAVLTTHGGVLRDLGQHTEALRLGEEAHALLRDNFRPCTLLGALNIELGNIDLGHDWYRKAEDRGASADNIDSELRSLIARMTPEKREEVIVQLLRIDSARYGWLRRKTADKSKPRV